MSTTYTAADFEEALSYFENGGSDYYKIRAALRIAARVMRPGLIEAVASVAGFTSSAGDLIARDIRAALTEDGNG